MILRRRLLVALGTVPMLSWLPGAQAQTSSSVRRIGILSAGSRETTRYLYAGFEAGLRELGYIEGKNVMLDYRFADGKFDRLPPTLSKLDDCASCPTNALRLNLVK